MENYLIIDTETTGEITKPLCYDVGYAICNEKGEIFERKSKEYGLEQYLVPLFISNFPGCTGKEMKTVDDFLNKHRWSLQQVQDYIPLPMTMGAAMYYTGKAPDGTPIEVNRGLAERRPQIEVLKKRRTPPRRK